ncbi:amidase [Microlunatus parietis]|uniref:Asp-tRNA(Asn)/Glu-tRNA(Gln) amidotransferase A subunit family amidase n=1 Tax=Microlunatus parietis TaxID=682979 RepID=A0A7Y9LAN9_9ACTN|nr:amidase [Microlunatus parietis]NYE69795.1 Asp-tRNA(Asn)/Glu-tRNA(Gln) amidotransferase A subunit family amidase [Microlunatus parietis]
MGIEERAEAALSAMARLDSDLHFVAEPWPDRARMLARAIAAQPAAERGPLAGVPFMIKDGTGPETPIVQRLIAAGAVPIGTTTRPDPRVDSQTWGWNGHDHTRNPWSLDRSSGGSSAGSAVAVAAGVVPFATGGDSAGSLRIPAAFCGVVGFKPTVGRIPRTGGRSLAQLTCAGVIGATVDDVATAVQVASGSHPLDPTALPAWRPAVPPAPAAQPTPIPEPVEGHGPSYPGPPVGAARVAQSSAGRGAEGVPPTGRPLRVAYSAALGFAATDPALAAMVRSRVQTPVDRGELDLVDRPVRLTDPKDAWHTLYALDRGDEVDHGDLRSALAYRKGLERTLSDLFAGVDALITPTTPQTAFPYRDYRDHVACDLCWAFNVSGHPAISVPVGLLDGLPVGAQVIAAPHRDDLAIRVARLIAVTLPAPPVS